MSRSRATINGGPDALWGPGESALVSGDITSSNDSDVGSGRAGQAGKGPAGE